MAIFGQVYLSAVQGQILVANLQLQNLHLVVPLLYYRGVPHWSAIQSRFNPSHDLRMEQKYFFTHLWVNCNTPSLPFYPSVCISGSHDGDAVSPALRLIEQPWQTSSQQDTILA